MAYRIDLRLPLEGEIRRLLSEELAGAIEDLRSADRTREDAIHEARKHLKKARAVLRLVRPFLGDSFAWENDVCRDAGHLLASARDAAAMVETVDRLRATARDPALWEALESRIAVRAEASALPRAEEERIMASFEERVRGIDVRLRAWRELPAGQADLAAGVARVFEVGRRRFRAARRRGDAESVHAWRKRTKDLWYHARLLRELGPLLAGWEADIDRLAEVLGQRHDIDVLEALLRAEPDLLEGSDSATIFAEVERLRRLLDRESALLGDVIYEGRSPDLGRLLTGGGVP